MNKTQKGAWSCLAGAILFLSLSLYLIIQIGFRHSLPDGIGRYAWLPPFIIIMAIGIIFFRKKQSPNEPDSDERDNQIKQRSVLVAFISVIPLFLAASLIPQLFIGLDGSIPVWSLPIVTVCIFYIVLLVYSIAVLVQYARGGKGEKS